MVVYFVGVQSCGFRINWIINISLLSKNAIAKIEMTSKLKYLSGCHNGSAVRIGPDQMVGSFQPSTASPFGSTISRFNHRFYRFNCVEPYASKPFSACLSVRLLQHCIIPSLIHVWVFRRFPNVGQLNQNRNISCSMCFPSTSD